MCARWMSMVLVASLVEAARWVRPGIRPERGQPSAFSVQRGLTERIHTRTRKMIASVLTRKCSAPLGAGGVVFRGGDSMQLPGVWTRMPIKRRTRSSKIPKPGTQTHWTGLFAFARLDSKQTAHETRHDRTGIQSPRRTRATTASRWWPDTYADLDTPLAIYLKLAHIRSENGRMSLPAGVRGGRRALRRAIPSSACRRVP